jgi:hypothetical protein
MSLKEFERGSESLGSFINRGWIDTLLSGEHRVAINACLEEKRYVVPPNFQAPSYDRLMEHVGGEILKSVGAYEPTEEGFVAVCKAFNAMKTDFVTAMAMSNSDVVIDWLQMRKGSKSAVLQLINNSLEALRTPFFPVCFASRIPKARREAILAILSLAFIGVTRLAQFVLSLFVIVFFGFTTFEIIRTFRQPAKRQYAA